MKLQKKKTEERKKENSTELQKPNVVAEVYNNSKKCYWIYTYKYTPNMQNQNSSTKMKYNILIQQTKETKNYIYQNKTN